MFIMIENYNNSINLLYCMDLNTYYYIAYIPDDDVINHGVKFQHHKDWGFSRL